VLHITFVKTINDVKIHILHRLRYIIDEICATERQLFSSNGDTTLVKELIDVVSPLLYRFS